MLGALLTEAQPVGFEDDRLVLVYPQSASFSKRKVEDPANQDRILEALRLITGRPVRIRVQLGETPAQSTASPGDRKPELDEDKIIEQFKDVFDAEDEPEKTPEDVPEGT